MDPRSRPAQPAAAPIFSPTPALDPAAYAHLAREVEGLLGIDISQYKAPQVWRRVNAFAAVRGLATPDALLVRARADETLRRAFRDMLTINVSEFFRNAEIWEAFGARFLAPLLRAGTGSRIWSAGCSLGYEPYTIAMLAREASPRASLRILATDLDRTILDRARRSRFTEAQMAGVSAARRERFFRLLDGEWEVRPEIRAMITFREHDLLKDAYERTFDAIVCRNVVIYFTEAAKNELYRRFAEALRPGGVLFLGATESIPNPRAAGLEPASLGFYVRA